MYLNIAVNVAVNEDVNVAVKETVNVVVKKLKCSKYSRNEAVNEKVSINL